MDQQADAPARDKDSHVWTSAAEILIAILLAMLGVWHIWKVQNPDAWTGFALVGLALLFYMTRGQTITRFAISTKGIEADLNARLKAAEKQAAAAEQKADEADQKADLAKGVVTQYTGPSSAPSSAAAKVSRKKTATASDAGWAHPSLNRKAAPADDPQKNQWGGEAARNNRLLDAEYETIDHEGDFDQSFEAAGQQGPVPPSRHVSQRRGDRKAEGWSGANHALRVGRIHSRRGSRE